MDTDIYDILWQTKKIILHYNWEMIQRKPKIF